MHVEAMIATHPQWRGEPASGLVRCVELCFDCAQSCIACADACLGEANVSELRRCISLNLDCADACFATGAMGSRQIGASDVTMRLMLQACADPSALPRDESPLPVRQRSRSSGPAILIVLMCPRDRSPGTWCLRRGLWPPLVPVSVDVSAGRSGRAPSRPRAVSLVLAGGPEQDRPCLFCSRALRASPAAPSASATDPDTHAVRYRTPDSHRHVSRGRSCRGRRTPAGLDSRRSS